MRTRISSVLVCSVLLAVLGGGLLGAETPSVTYLGRATIKIVTAKNFVIYVDPYGHGDYSQKADLLLVTHGHDDHNAVNLVKLNEKAVIAAPNGAVYTPAYRSVHEGDQFLVNDVQIRVVPAYNRNHSRQSSFGYLISFDGLTLYHAGDTSFIPEMNKLSSAAIDYAFLPTDGYYNMGGDEAGKCADAIQARYVTAIHSSADDMYDKANAAKLVRPNVLPLAPGESLPLKTKTSLMK